MSAPISSAPPTARLASLDAYRGLVMLLMMGEVLRFCSVARALPESGFWSFLCHHQSHADWIGCSLHDLIQPSFSFLVGVALPFSIASRTAKGQSFLALTGHAWFRALILILLGIFLRSTGRTQTNFTFEDTLTQIGLGYGFLFVLGFRPVREQWAAFALIVAGYWAAFVLYPLPAPDFAYGDVGVSSKWLAEHGLNGFAAHWNKNSNPAWAFDVWFLNLFPREKLFAFNGGGYATLSFIPTLATMILGLIVGGMLRSDRPPMARIQWLCVAGLAGLVLGWALDWSGLCPLVKRIWTPGWTLFSGGWCCLLLAGFYFLVDVVGLQGIVFPLVVVGMNSIAAYLMAHLFEGFILKALKTNFGQDFFKLFGASYEPLFHGAAALLVLWMLLFWMYRRKLFLRI